MARAAVTSDKRIDRQIDRQIDRLIVHIQINKTRLGDTRLGRTD